MWNGMPSIIFSLKKLNGLTFYLPFTPHLLPFYFIYQFIIDDKAIKRKEF